MKTKSKIIIIITVLTIVMCIVAIPCSASSVISNPSLTTNYDYIIPLDMIVNYTKVDTNISTNMAVSEPKYNQILYNPNARYSGFNTALLTGVQLANDTSIDFSAGNPIRSVFQNGTFSKPSDIFNGYSTFQVFSYPQGEDLTYAASKGNITYYMNEYYDNNTISYPFAKASVSGYPSFSYNGYISEVDFSEFFGRYFPNQYHMFIASDVNPSVEGYNMSQEYTFRISFDLIEFENGEYIYENISRNITVKNSPYIRHYSMPADYYFFDNVASVYSSRFNVGFIGAQVNLWDLLVNVGNIPRGAYIRNLSFSLEPELNDLYINPSIMEFNSRFGCVPMLCWYLQYTNAGSPGFNAIENIRESYDNWIASNTEDISYVSLSNFSLTDWLGNTLSGVFTTDILGPLSIGDILFTVLGVAFTIAILKFFAGG